MCGRLQYKKSTRRYTQAVLKFPKLNAQTQQREAVVQGQSLSPYRLRYITPKSASSACGFLKVFFGKNFFFEYEYELTIYYRR
jgi:hypothetical protein